MVVDGTWVYRCPICGKALQHIEPGSVIYNTPIYCRRCKGRELDTDVPFPLKTE